MPTTNHQTATPLIMTDSLTTLPTIHASLGTTTQTIPTLHKFLNDKTSTKPNVIGAVPITTSLVSQVNNVIIQKVQQQQQQQQKDDDDDEVMEDGYTLVHYVDLKSFVPKTLDEQLNEVSISWFVDVSNEIMEKVLSELIQGDFKWSCVEEVDLKVVFVRLTNDELEKNCREIKNLLTLDGSLVQKMKLKVSVEKNTSQLLLDTLGDDTQAEEVDTTTTVAKIVKVLEKSKNTKTTKIKDMDYIIDESELKDIPEDVLPQLRKDIKEFRLKALENEKKKREKEVLEEKKRAKLQLRKLFEKFRNETSGGAAMDVDDDDEEEDEEDDGLTDEQYEELQSKKQQQEMLRKFAIKLQIVHQEEKKNADLVKELSELKKYESTLDKTIKEEYKLGKFRPSGRNKDRELEADERDRKEEAEESEAKKNSDEFLTSINIPLKVSREEEGDPDVLTIDDHQLDNILLKIKPKINEYIEELMGVADDEMADYIASIVKDERSKAKLLSELEEPMGDDAAGLAEKVWADVQALL